jgi:hypothetical protein
MSAPTPPSSPAWVVDPTIRWRILLTATVPGLPAPVLEARLRRLHQEQNWPEPPAVAGGSPAELRRGLAEVAELPLVVGRSDDLLVISAHHSRVDGLGLLDVLAALTGSAVSSSTRGVAGRSPDGSLAAGLLRRLREVAFTPPAPIAGAGDGTAPGDSFVAGTIEARVTTAQAVAALARAVVERNAAAGVRARHVAVAVGAGLPAAGDPLLANRSALLRLVDVERLSAAQVSEQLRARGLDHAGGTGAPGGALSRVAMRVLAPRLGSTLLVSHLGEVTAPQAGTLAFYPVTAGGSGVSAGLVTHGGRTTLTLRARARQWDEAALGGLLEEALAALGRRG